jgi:hypothetical protein
MYRRRRTSKRSYSEERRLCQIRAEQEKERERVQGDHWLRRFFSALYSTNGVRSMLVITTDVSGSVQAYDLNGWYRSFGDRMHRLSRPSIEPASCTWASFITSLAMFETSHPYRCQIFLIPFCPLEIIFKTAAVFNPEQAAHIFARRAREWFSGDRIPVYMSKFNSIEEEARRKLAAEALFDVYGMRDLIKMVQMYME